MQFQKRRGLSLGAEKKKEEKREDGSLVWRAPHFSPNSSVRPLALISLKQNWGNEIAILRSRILVIEEMRML